MTCFEALIQRTKSKTKRLCFDDYDNFDTLWIVVPLKTAWSVMAMPTIKAIEMMQVLLDLIYRVFQTNVNLF